MIGRRELLAGGLALAVPAPAVGQESGVNGMYGLIGKLRTAPGQREAMLAILLEGTRAMPGCLSYIVAKDKADLDAIWITEVWDSAASHRASLRLPAVRAAIARARPLIAGFEPGTETEPVGGIGLPR